MNEELNKRGDANVGLGSEITKPKRIKKLAIGAVVGLLFGILSDVVFFLTFWGALAFWAPANFIFSFNTSLYDGSNVVLLLFIYPIEYAILGMSVMFFLDKSYRFVIRLCILAILLIVIFTPSFVQQYNYQKGINIIHSMNEKSDIETCSSLQDSFDENHMVNIKEECLYQLLHKTKNPELCKQVYKNDPLNQNKCIESIVASTSTNGTTTNSTNSVNNISTTNNTSDILSGINATLNETDINSCLKTDSLQNKNYCIYHVAVNTKDKEVCNQIDISSGLPQYSILKDNCLYFTK